MTSLHLRANRAPLVEKTSGKLTKAELSKAIALNCGSSLKEGKELLELIFERVGSRAFPGGERIELRGLGSFAVRVRRGRVGRNPKTGAPVEVQAKRVPYFRASKRLRTVLGARAGGCI